MTQKKSHPFSKRFRGFLPVVVDVETSGLDVQKHALLEVAAVIIDMHEDGTLHPQPPLSFNVTPFSGAEFDPQAMKVNKIILNDEHRHPIDEKEALTTLFQAIRKKIKDVDCNRAVLVGHNASLDLAFVHASANRSEIKRNPFHPFTSFDTATLAGLAYGQTVLAKACDVAQIDFDVKKAHSAAYDAKKTAELFCSINNQWHTYQQRQKDQTI